MNRATIGLTPVAPRSADLDKFAQVFIDAFPAMSADDQRLALTLYRALACGRPVSREQLAQMLDRPLDSVQGVLSAWPGIFYDDDSAIIGFWGLTVREMSHRLEWDRTRVYAWCAWDTLFLPELLDTRATVGSHCADTGTPLRLVVSPDRVERVDPNSLVVSFLMPDERELRASVTTSFCHFVHFFRDRSAGRHWTAAHPGTFLLSLDEAFTLGQRVNAARYRDVLRKQDDSL